MMKIRGLLGLTLAVAACQFDPHAGSYTTREPDAADLVGTYVPTASTAQYIRRGGYPDAPSRVVLESGGTIVLQNIPDVWQDPFGLPHGNRVSASGEWSVERNDDNWVLGLHMPPGTRADLPNGYVTQVFLERKEPPHRIHFIIGDPDGGEALVYERVGPAR